MGKTNENAVTHVELMQVRNMHKKDGKSITAIAKEIKRGQETVKNMVNSKSLSEFRRLQAQRSEREKARKQAKRQNTASVKKTAEEIINSAKQTYSKREVKTLIDGLLRHTNSLEERLQTIVSLLIEADDNLVTRVYRLESKKGKLRRFLERF